MSLAPQLRAELQAILGPQHVKDDAVTLYSYRADGLVLHPAAPEAVVFPADTQQLQAVVRLLHQHQVPFLPRGAGTGLSGGAIPSRGGVIVEMVRFTHIKNFDPVNRTIEVGPGVVNIHVSRHVASEGLYFVPDPSSQKACTVGGNVAENSGGPHTLKYGVTTNHVTGLEVVLPDGELVRLGGNDFGTPGPDLVGLMVGSEGTFGIVTSVTCRLTALPERVITLLAGFPTVAAAGETVSGIIRAGIVPAALEMLDRVVIEALNKAGSAAFPADVEAVLIIEIEDLDQGLDEEAGAIRSICESLNGQVREARDAAEREDIWAARKGAFAAIGAISPSSYTQDGVIPRTALPRVLEQVAAIGARFSLTVANVFHAGDGNLHPLILYNGHDPKQVEAVHEAGRLILEACLEAGGSLSGEHGIGLEKAHLMDQVYTESDMDHMQQVRATFNPENLLNPDKIFPTPGKCAEAKYQPKRQGISA